MQNIKTELYKLCLDIVKERLENARLALQSADEGSEEETKSSAGDKYETGREMLQQVKDRAQTQANEANKLLVALQSISTGSIHNSVQPGSVVITDNGNFYLAISAGTLTCEGKNYFAVSPASPIGTKMQGLKKGDSFEMNGRKYGIVDVM